MAANSQTAEYIDAAKRRWPQYSITGNGSIAVVFHCNHRIELCTMPMLAQTIVGERCGQYCDHVRNPEYRWHEIERLELPRPPVLVTVRDWERD
jgi:hypothetical protein